MNNQLAVNLTQSSQPTSIVGNKYKILEKIGSGAFGIIYLGVNILTGDQVAIKVEKNNAAHLQLEYEAKVYKNLLGTPMVPWIHFFGQTPDGSGSCLVMELLGSSLEELFNYCGRKFSSKTVLMLGDQMVHRLEYLHYKHFIHRDIKPDNFAMGMKDTSKVYLLDFGLAKRFRDPKTCTHIVYRENKNLTGTARYVSINTHLGIEQSRRDDLESLGYVLLYFLRGQLPWQGLTAKNKQDKYQKIMKTKMTTPLEILCKNLPQEFITYMTYCRSLEFAERPDYSHLRKLFKSAFERANLTYDFMFDWVLKFRQSQVVDSTEEPIAAPEDAQSKRTLAFLSTIPEKTDAVN